MSAWRSNSNSPPPRLRVAVAAEPIGDLSLQKAAARLAVDQHFPFIAPGQSPADEIDALLCVTPDRLELRVLRGEASIKQGKPVAVNLQDIDTTSPEGRSLKQPLFKAMGIKARKDLPITVLDATAGWGNDAWMLASIGCQVLAAERNRVMATLLRDAVLRAGSQQPEVLMRLHVVQTDARHLLRRLAQRGRHSAGGQSSADDAELPASVRAFFEPDVVYLDPMYPEHEKRSTAARKPMVLARHLVGDDDDAPELLHWALRLAQKRVVVKRPMHAPPLGDSLSPAVQATTSIEGKSHRLDVYVRTRG